VTTEPRSLTEITIWYRGVVEGRLARKIGNSLADAARAAGKHVQAFDNYVDLPDRVYVPCRFYVRISPEPIAEPYLYENYTPSIVICTDAAMAKGCNILGGILPGSTLLVNTRNSPESVIELLSDLRELSRLKTVATVDAGMAHEYHVPYGGVEGASEKAAQLHTAAIMAGALNAVVPLVDLSDLSNIETDVRGLAKGAEHVKTAQNPHFVASAPAEEGAAHTYRGKVNLVLPAPEPGTEQPGHITGNYRLERPVIDPDKCNRCRICWAACPDACIEVGSSADDPMKVNLKYCKGCGICWYICPVKAIAAHDELNYAGGIVRV
jgi:oxalate oxidoreductase subunit delta